MEKLITTIYQANISKGSRFSITIPTYNRFDNLIANLNWLNEIYIEDSFEVIILDNHSYYNLKSLIASVENAKYPIHIFQNNYHIGPDSNVVRSMELANNEWILLLGDSKLLRKESISFILRDIDENLNIHGIVYSYDSRALKEAVISDIDSFLKLRINYGDMILGANSLFTKSSFIEILPKLSMMTMSRSMLSIIHIGNLQKNRSILFSDKQIVESFLQKPKDYSPKLSILECWAQFSLILGMSFNARDSKRLNKKIIHNENLKTRIEFLKFTLIQLVQKRNDIENHLRRILKWRYTSYVLIHEYLMVVSIFFLSKILRFIKYTRFDDQSK